MKLLIASDIHGCFESASSLKARIDAENADKIILLGDLLYHGPRNDLPCGYNPKKVISLLNEIKHKIIAVRGNCEAEVDQMVLEFPCMADYTTVISESGNMLFATHGHKFNPENMPSLNSGSIFMYGHTHIKRLEKSSDVYILNPGSVSIPKDGSKSYATYENGTLSLKTLDGDIISVLETK